MSIPAYRRQREKNRADRAYCRIDGKRIKLGVYDSAESLAKYAKLIKGVANSPAPDTSNRHISPSVNEVLVAFLEYAATYYRQPNGKPSTQYFHFREAARYLRRMAGDSRAIDFGPRKLKAIRKAMIDRDIARIHINGQISRLVRIFRWAASEEMVPGSVAVDLATVEGLRQGRTEARETPPVLPVKAEVVEATLPCLPDVVGDIVRLQLLTGARPGEICNLRPCDLNRTGEVWIYRPAKHKTQHHGKLRTIAIGPRGQDVLLRYLARNSQTYCFRPCDSERKRRYKATVNRQTPASCGNVVGTNRKASPQRPAGEKYTKDSYRRAIHRACDKAFPHPSLGCLMRESYTDAQRDELRKWQSDHRWNPNRLRHTAATEIRREFGLEAAQVVLGHSSANITEVYAERDLDKAMEVALKIG